jgi:hypothetical protein
MTIVLPSHRATCATCADPLVLYPRGAWIGADTDTRQCTDRPAGVTHQPRAVRPYTPAACTCGRTPCARWQALRNTCPGPTPAPSCCDDPDLERLARPVRRHESARALAAHTAR